MCEVTRCKVSSPPPSPPNHKTTKPQNPYYMVHLLDR